MSRHFLKPWRAQSEEGVTRIAPAEPFDELAVGDWLHVEVMEDDSVWLNVAHLNLNVRRERDGMLHVYIDADGEDVPAVVTLREEIAGLAPRERLRAAILKAYDGAREHEGKAPKRERLLEELRRAGVVS
jgi:hypothetical protein